MVCNWTEIGILPFPRVKNTKYQALCNFFGALVIKSIAKGNYFGDKQLNIYVH
jgi:hypothetical protein